MTESDTPSETSPSTEPEETSSESDPARAERVPIVGIGASAGGVQALESFFSHLPNDSGMAFVVLMHLSSEHESNLSGILRHHTDLTVRKIEDGMTPEPNGVYVLPPNTNLRIEDGQLHLAEVSRSHGRQTVIDQFFRALAGDQKDDAIGIILSGTGTDGTQGMRTIKEQGGFTMVQDPEDALYDGMPRCAIDTDLIDVIAPAERLSAKLTQYWTHAVQVGFPGEAEEMPEEDEQVVRKILAHLYTETGHDFSDYKRSTVMRRIARRLTVNQCVELGEYLNLLRGNEEEIVALLRELLVCVTGFFRDPEAFAALEENVIPRLFEGKNFDDQVRLWSAGCATGEEAYSLAMLLHEQAEELDSSTDLQIFATDLSGEAVETAREGLYAESVASDLTTDRLERYLKPEGAHYRVRQELRDMVLFAQHNLLEDPPFSELDLVSCRNVLIYLNREVQERVFELLHYALRPEGFLFLGGSESIAAADGFFSPVDKQHSIFQRRPDPEEETRTAPILPMRRRLGGTPPVEQWEEPDQTGSDTVHELHRRLLMEDIASIIVDDNYEIVHLTDRAARYLEYRGGAPTHDVLEVVPGQLRRELRGKLYQVFQKGQASDPQWITTKIGDEPTHLSIRVRPVGEGTNFAQILLHEVDRPHSPTGAEVSDDESSGYTAELEEELRRTKEELQTTIEEYETTTEELEASNEELLSMNEELQSKNEEIETSKEELQSVNEELKTTNQELKTKIDELRRSNSDLQNLMEATDIATLFLDRDLRIQRFTPRVRELFNLQATDVGRALADFSQKFQYSNLIEDAQQVLDTLQPVEEELRSEQERWFLVRLRPYRTVNDRIDGVVITFVDITDRKRAEIRLREERNFVNSVLDTVGALVVVMDPEGRIVRFNNKCEEVSGYSFDEVEGKSIFDLLVPPDEQEEVEALLNQYKDGQNQTVKENHWRTKEGERRLIRWSNTVLRNEDGQINFVIGTGIDITERRQLERQVVAATDKERRRIGQNLHDMLASQLAGTTMMASALADKLDPEEAEAADEIRTVADLIRDASEQARSLSHSLIPLEVKDDDLSDALRNLAERQNKMSDATCSFEACDAIPPLSEEVASHFYRIAAESVNNAIKHADPNEIEIGLDVEEDCLVLTVRDDGVGIQKDLDPTDGLGLHMMQYRSDLIGARLDIEPARDGGTFVRCSLPLEKVSQDVAVPVEEEAR